MGRTVVDIVVSNYADLLNLEHGRMTADKVRRVTISGVVNTGAAKLVLPQSVVDQLGLPVSAQVSVRYADNRRAVRSMVKDAHVVMAGRSSVFTAVVEPDRTEALIGAIVMEELDLLVDCPAQRVVPREPERIFAELE